MVAVTKTQEIALDQARRLLGRLAFEMNHVVKSCDADRIHNLRVAIRRFSQLLGVFKTSFAGKDVRKLRRRLKKFLGAAGEVRNCDIALKLLAKSPAADSELLRSKLIARRKDCERTLLNALQPWTQRKTSLKWRSALESAATAAQPSRFAEDMEQRTLSQMAKNFFSDGHEAAAAKDPKGLHEFRITAKKFRYTLELFAPFHGQTFSRLAGSLKPVQGLLGDINDCETMRDIVANYEGSASLDAWLKKRQQKRIGEFRQHWEEYFGDRQSERAWMEQLNRVAVRPRTARKPVKRSGTLSSSRTLSAAAG